jgi:hypothetical protein
MSHENRIEHGVLLRLGAILAGLLLVGLLPAAQCNPASQVKVAEICWTNSDCGKDQTCVGYGATTPLDCPGGHAYCSVPFVDEDGGIYGPGFPQCGCATDAKVCNVPPTLCGGHCVVTTCKTATDCPAGDACVYGSCLPGCATSSDCSSGQVCRPSAEGYCLDTNHSSCTDPGAPNHCLEAHGADGFDYLSTWALALLQETFPFAPRHETRGA